jgi:hypothetical protein
MTRTDRPPDMKKTHGSLQMRSVVIGRIQPNAPAQPRKVQVVSSHTILARVGDEETVSLGYSR